MTKSLVKQIEEYIEDWHWDKKSKKYAFEMGKFLFRFMDYIDDLNISKKTKRKHQDNVYLIGSFEAQYGYNDNFSPKNLEGEPNFLYEFERKVSNSKYAIQSYKSTWKKLDRYIKSCADNKLQCNYCGARIGEISERTEEKVNSIYYCKKCVYNYCDQCSYETKEENKKVQKCLRCENIIEKVC